MLLQRPEPDSIDTREQSFTMISLIQYTLTTGLIMRTPKESKLIGYCINPPKEVLEKLFSDFYVTRYLGIEFFSHSDTRRDNPMLGIGIDSISPVCGIKGTIEEIAESPELLEVKRNSPVSDEEINRILSYLRGESFSVFSPRIFIPGPSQKGYDKKQAIEILEKIKVVGL